MVLRERDMEEGEEEEFLGAHPGDPVCTEQWLSTLQSSELCMFYQQKDL